MLNILSKLRSLFGVPGRRDLRTGGAILDRRTDPPTVIMEPRHGLH